MYDFVATPTEVHPGSSVTDVASAHTAHQTSEQIALGRQLGVEIAAQLVQEIRDMGLPAARASNLTKTQINDIVLRGYLLSIDEGSVTKRVVIGFGVGSSHLTTAVEGFQVTAQGLRKLGAGSLESGGSQGPGATLGSWVSRRRPTRLD